LSVLSKDSSVFFSLTAILSSSPEILSSTCSSMLQWLLNYFLFGLRDFIFPGFDSLLFETFHIFLKFLFCILCCLP
jgi:hypothetical protein